MTAYHDRLTAGHYQAAPPADEATVADLKTQLANLGQPVTGTKAELQARLEQATAAAAPAE